MKTIRKSENIAQQLLKARATARIGWARLGSSLLASQWIYASNILSTFKFRGPLKLMSNLGIGAGNTHTTSTLHTHTHIHTAHPHRAREAYGVLLHLYHLLLTLGQLDEVPWRTDGQVNNMRARHTHKSTHTHTHIRIYAPRPTAADNRTGTRCWLPGGPNNVSSLCSAESLKPNQNLVIPRSFSFFSFFFSFLFRLLLLSPSHLACGLPHSNATDETNMLNSCEYLA